jgi:hypothetical protein
VRPDDLIALFHLHVPPANPALTRAVSDFLGIYDTGLSAATLATINSILAGLWILNLSDTNTPHRVRKLEAAGHVIANPAVRDKMRLRGAFDTVGMCAVASTLLMVIFRPVSACNDGCGEYIYSRILGAATDVTALGIIAGLLIYWLTWPPLRSLPRGPDGRPLSGFVRQGDD